MIKKRGEGLTLNTIVIAAIVLVVLVVLWFIFTGQIGRSSGQIDDVGNEAGKQVNEVTWCLSITLRGQSCEVDACPGETGPGPRYTTSSNKKTCSITCASGQSKYLKKGIEPIRISCAQATTGRAEGAGPGNLNGRYMCCGKETGKPNTEEDKEKPKEE